MSPRKGEIGGLTFFSTFFSIVEKTGNIQMLASSYKTYIRRFGEDAKKKEKKKGDPYVNLSVCDSQTLT